MADMASSAELETRLLTACRLELGFCGERHLIASDRFCLGARADLNLDDPPVLPDLLLELHQRAGMWFVVQLVAGPVVTLADQARRWRAILTAGRPVPLVFAEHVITIAADRAGYEVEVSLAEAPYIGSDRSEHDGRPLVFGDPPPQVVVGDADRDEPARVAMAAGITLNREQRALVTVLAEPVLRRGSLALSEIPSSVDAARRLAWPVTKFNRKLDTVCGKLDRAGVSGLHGGSRRPALNRRTRLVQFAVESGVVSAADLALLENPRAVAQAAPLRRDDVERGASGGFDDVAGSARVLVGSWPHAGGPVAEAAERERAAAPGRRGDEVRPPAPVNAYQGSLGAARR